ncbi:hypothetical protein EVC45_43445 [Paraburkholderia sp. UYCP14C]|uniref:hypothetical protein n=1 Tax=Paraburkholderia sp. UYCP14C TaxID=2511130 RepID=UPI00101F06F8|nr:hypothetical protein [Paraburkholderia sp. UYCP14C]RZF23608.1 hypothetical protein EVC45_43445 [Paraburkholderia sp. UYCP14C]
MQLLIGLLLAVIASVAQAECAYQITGPSGKAYAEDSIPDFVASEIRPVLNTIAHSIGIDITKVCDQSVSGALHLTMDTQNYYIVNIQQHVLSDVESKYTDSDVLLSRSNLEAYFDTAMSFDTLEMKDRQDVVKTLAFYFAESARFSDVERITIALLAGGCSQDWTQYAHLVRRCGRISGNAIEQGLANSVFRGGSNDNLIAPISADMIARFNTANPNDYVNVPAPNCPRNAAAGL